jgi:hypothetical protein
MYGTFPNFGSRFDKIVSFTNSITTKPLFIGNDKKIEVPELFQHRKTSKITDNLNGLLAGFSFTMIISEKLKELLKTMKVFEMSFFKTIYTTLENKELDYYFVKAKVEALESIDYDKTEFYEWENIGPLNKSKKNPLKFKNKDELINYEKNGGVAYEILKLVIDKNWEYDFFALKMVEDFALCFIVSEKLKEQMEQEGITGVGFLELNVGNPK